MPRAQNETFKLPGRPRSHILFVLCPCACAVFGLAAVFAGEEDPRYLSHPPIRKMLPVGNRPMGGGPGYFVDPDRGDDDHAGSRARPWRTINNSLKRLSPGDTLYLRAGIYFENVYCAVAGKPDAPITVRAYPGERVIIDGGIPEFQTKPAKAWKPFPDGAAGEFISTQTYKNIRDVVGLFADSNVGLQTYWHLMDLRSASDFWMTDPEKKEEIAPVYCGPGIWYDRETGHIHARLAHTHLPNSKVANYQGETDPRKLPLVIAPFQSTPLFVDLAKHVRFQDLVFRGGGYKTVHLLLGVNVSFENCTIFCGTYGIWAKNTGPLKMTHCGVHGIIPPWGFASENGLQTYTPRYTDPFLRDALPLYCEMPLPPYDRAVNIYQKKPYAEALKNRNVARLNSHALLVTEGGYEFETFFYPFNHDWDVSYCEFTDGHDGVYPSGRSIRFHHNWIDRVQDDGIYLSSPTPYVSDDVYVYQNLLTRTLSAFALHGRGGPKGDIYVYRNIVDFREPTLRIRPGPAKPEGELASGQIFLKHGYELLNVESIYWYQNTFIAPVTHGYTYAHATLLNTSETTVRRCFNNLFVYLSNYPPPGHTFKAAGVGTTTHDIQMDGNLHWCPKPDEKIPEGFFDMARTCEAALRSKKIYPAGWEANSAIADPQFLKFSAESGASNDYRPQAGGPAAGKGIVLPAEWEDPLRPAAGAQPDIGALPAGAEPLRVGVQGRITAGAAASTP
ncbi:MAG: hypothetical protein HYU36_14985 [Planctomycetes bacterium]|nr:hypothetical protein [Planctomycetota bacterium]